MNVMIFDFFISFSISVIASTLKQEVIALMRLLSLPCGKQFGVLYDSLYSSIKLTFWTFVVIFLYGICPSNIMRYFSSVECLITFLKNRRTILIKQRKGLMWCRKWWKGSTNSNWHDWESFLCLSDSTSMIEFSTSKMFLCYFCICWDDAWRWKLHLRNFNNKFLHFIHY